MFTNLSCADSESSPNLHSTLKLHNVLFRVLHVKNRLLPRSAWLFETHVGHGKINKYGHWHAYDTLVLQLCVSVCESYFSSTSEVAVNDPT